MINCESNQSINFKKVTNDNGETKELNYS